MALQTNFEFCIHMLLISIYYNVLINNFIIIDKIIFYYFNIIYKYEKNHFFFIIKLFLSYKIL